MPFACSICEQESNRICVFCTKDACDNHLCQRCGGCSDCCECEVPLDETAVHAHPVPPAVTNHVASPGPGVPDEATALDLLLSEPPETSEV